MTSAFPQPLLDGYRGFLKGRFARENQRFAELAATGQRPKTMVIGCCDSRVSPEVIFDAGPGEIFVARNVANLVPPYETGGGFHGTSAALEYAVQALHVSHIVVLGHASCGGFQYFADYSGRPLSPGDFIGKWMNLMASAADSVCPRPDEASADYVDRLAQAAIGHSLANLKTFPCVRTLVDRGKLALHGAWFGIATGILSLRDPITGKFLPVVDSRPDRISVFACQ
jgi:carbonic anhydrase